jgi:hypothetical protein
MYIISCFSHDHGLDLSLIAERDGKNVPTDPLLVGFLTNFASMLLLFPVCNRSCIHLMNGNLYPYECAYQNGWICQFVALLSYSQGHPEHGPFYLVKGLLNVVKGFKAWENASEAKTKVYLAILALFCSYAQAKFPYHIEKGTLMLMFECTVPCRFTPVVPCFT